MRIRYNAPVTLTFVFMCAAFMCLASTIAPNLMNNWLSVGGRGSFSFGNLHSYIMLFSHVFGHASWDHLVSNMLLILVVGPMLEEVYGASEMIFMIAVTAFITGLLNVLFFSTGLLGASGVVFMLILLASFTNFRRGEIPLTFILVLLLYIGGEVYEAAQKTDSVSHFTHIAGGLCGSLFGFFKDTKVVRTSVNTGASPK